MRKTVPLSKHLIVHAALFSFLFVCLSSLVCQPALLACVLLSSCLLPLVSVISLSLVEFFFSPFGFAESPVSFVQLFLLANHFSFCMLTLHTPYLSRHSITVQKHFIDVCLYDNCNLISLFLLNNFTHTNCVSCALFGVLWLW